MPIIKIELWKEQVRINQDGYGKAVIDTARNVMEILDTGEPFNCHKIICDGDRGYGITGFQAGCVAQLVSHVHSRGEEFRTQWNIENQIGDEGERANKSKSGGVLNPALRNMEVKDDNL
jgi:hypothetical protein